MAIASVVNQISGYSVTFLGDDEPPRGGFLGWIQLKRADGHDAGYIYLSDKPVPAHLGGVGRQPDGPYVVISRPVSQAVLLIAVLQSGRSMQIRYAGDENGGGTAFLEDQGPVLSVSILDDARSRFGIVPNSS